MGHKGTFMKPIFVVLLAVLLMLMGLESGAAWAEEILSKERLLGPDNNVPLEIKAQRLSYRGKEGLYVAEGDVVIRRNEYTLSAQKATYNPRTGVAKASGEVRFESGRDILTGERGTFNLKDHTGRIEEGTLFLKENHFYFKADVAEKLDDGSYMIESCVFTTCNGENPVWTITGKHVKVSVGGYGEVNDAAFRVYDMPLLYVPYAVFPAKTKRQTGFLRPGFGYSGRNGLDFELPFFWVISDRVDATFYQRLLSRRGYMQGLELRYVTAEQSKGIVLFDILSDSHDKDMGDPDDVELSPFSRTNRTRYWFRSKVDQDLPYGIKARLDADFVSDQDYLLEFKKGVGGSQGRPRLEKEFGRPFEERRSPTRRSALRLSRDGEVYSLQAFSGYHQRPEDPARDDTPQPLAGLQFSLMPTQVKSLPLFCSIDSDYQYIWREDGRKGHHYALSPEFWFPFWVGKYVEFEPSVRYTLTAQWFDDTLDGRHSQSREAYEGGVRLSTNLERIYGLNLWGAKQLKHRVRPALRYRYRVHRDRDELAPWFEPMDGEGKANELIFSLENFFDARIEREGRPVTYRQWATLDLTQEYDIDETRRDLAPGEQREPFGPLSIECIVRPFDEMDLRGGAQWDHYDQEIEFAHMTFELAVNRSGGRKDKFALDYLYQNMGQEILNFMADVNLAYGFSGGVAFERNVDLNKSVSSSYWLEYRAQCVGVRVTAAWEEGETSVMVTFLLRGLGNHGAW